MIERILKNKLADLAGTHLKGSIVASDELVNLVIKEGVSNLLRPSVTINEAVEPSSEAATKAPNPRELLTALDISKLTYRTEKGKTILDLDVRI